MSTLQSAFRAASPIEQANFFEFVIREATLAFARPGTAAIEAGAAFEPNPSNAAGVEKLSLEYPWIELHRMALLDRNGIMPFYLASEMDVGSLREATLLGALRPRRERPGRDRRAVSRLDNVAAIRAEVRTISFIKCDVEGEDLAFLDDAATTIAEHAPIIMLKLE